MNRKELIQKLKNTPQPDMIVIGGGATGLGVALDATLRGLNVVLIDSHDFASGTSSRSTKLLHGGVRYLAQGNISLVKEALGERQTVMNIAPHLAQPLAFVMPTYKWWQKLWYGLGLKVYDFLAGKLSLGKTTLLSGDNTAKALPGLSQYSVNGKLQGGVKYWDGQFDDARLAINLAKTASDNGATLVNYMEVKALEARKEGGFRVTVKDTFSDAQFSLSSACVVNAAGVWVDKLRKQAAEAKSQTLKQPKMVAPSQGVHLVVDKSHFPGQNALLIPKTEDGRVLFAVPWLGSVILGTTDTPRQDLPREPKPFEHEIDFIISEANKVFAKPISKEDVKSVWTGLRPLVQNSDNESTKTISREHTILVEQSGLITVTGGKWTTYRVMASEVVDKAIEEGLIKTSKLCVTQSTPLSGSNLKSTATSLTEPPGAHLFGSEISVVEMYQGANNALGFGLTEAMVRYCANHEHAITVEDVLARRWRVLFLNAKTAIDMASEVARILSEETGLDPKLNEFNSMAKGYLLCENAQK